MKIIYFNFDFLEFNICKVRNKESFAECIQEKTSQHINDCKLEIGERLS